MNSDKQKQVKQNQVLEILEYWKLIELLGQNSVKCHTPNKVRKIAEKIEYAREFRQNKKNAQNGKSAIDSKEREPKKPDKKIEIFHDIRGLDLDVKKIIERDNEYCFPYQDVSSEISFCIGNIRRNDVVEHLEKYFTKKKDERPELAYPKNESIAWFSFRTDAEGKYVEDSFQLSPILWALSQWRDDKAYKTHVFALNTCQYKKVISEFSEKLQESNIVDFFKPLYKKIYKLYVKGIFELPSYDEFDDTPDVCDILRETQNNSKVTTDDNFRDSLNQVSSSNPRLGFMAYECQESAVDKTGGLKHLEYSDLGMQFFLDDLEMLIDAVSEGKFGDNSEYERKVIDYILSPLLQHSGDDNSTMLNRINISPKQPKKEMRIFFEEALDIRNAPVAKWPSRFMPALMQQVAVNIAIQEPEVQPIFSVNGPPGTGKTTMLKEIVANNIVERARLIAHETKNGRDPDSLFSERSFKQGPLEKSNSYYKFAPHYYALKNDKINDFGMLVASSNNAAVENITKDLPNGSDILAVLDSSEVNNADVAQGLDELRVLFDYKNPTDLDEIQNYGKIEARKDIFFTQYAQKLLGSTDCWGLVSAPLGKTSNINDFCKKVLKPFAKDYNKKEVREAHKKKFRNVCQDFMEQYEHVIDLRHDIEEICEASKGVDAELLSLSLSELCERERHLVSQSEKIKQKLDSERLQLINLEETKPSGFFSLFKRKSNSPVRDELICEKKESVSALKRQYAESEHEILDVKKAKKFRELCDRYSDGARKITLLDDKFIDNYTSDNEKESTLAQVSNPWFTEQYNREREKLFLLACKLHKEFVTSSKCVMQNVRNLLIAWNRLDGCENRMGSADKKEAMPYLLQNLFLITPVISTTFASVQTFLKDVRCPGALGTLIIDEAGQAQPHMAVGAMFRCRHAVIVGDPKQIEPVVTGDTDIFKQLLGVDLLTSYKDKKLSVQGFADYINPYGTWLGDGQEREWVGCPLIVHRRCIDPMYSISNELSYDGTMKQQTGAPSAKLEATFVLDKSCWIDVKGTEGPDKKNHYVSEQGEVVLKLLEAKFDKLEQSENSGGEIPKIIIITPFTSVKNGIKKAIKRSDLCRNGKKVDDWLKANTIGTVHTFQGQDSDEVIFLLGCDAQAPGAVKWVSKNIVNVAATRAKYRFYVVGDREVWSANPSLKLTYDIISEEEGAVVDADDLRFGI